MAPEPFDPIAAAGRDAQGNPMTVRVRAENGEEAEILIDQQGETIAFWRDGVDLPESVARDAVRDPEGRTLMVMQVLWTTKGHQFLAVPTDEHLSPLWTLVATVERTGEEPVYTDWRI
jgi:hypothetical protein